MIFSFIHQFDTTFGLRVFYSIELLICCTVIWFIRGKIEGSILRDVCKKLSVSLLILSLARFTGALLDILFGIETGVISLIINDGVWFYYSIYYKIWNQTY